MRLRWTAAVVACAIGATALSSCGRDHGAIEERPVPPPTDEPRSSFFGIAGGQLFAMAVAGQADLLSAHLEQIAAAPIASVRSTVDWRRAEPEAPAAGRHSYSFGEHDAWVAALASHGLRWAPAILGWPVPPWAADPALVAECSSQSPPAGTANYAAFAAALAERYGPDGSFWERFPDLPYVPVEDYEIWNEPNLSAFWCPSPDPDRFAELVVASSRAIRAVDPEARIVLGGLAPIMQNEPEDGSDRLAVDGFLEAAIAADPDLNGAIDAVGVHSYAPDPESVLAQLAWYRDVLDSSGFAGKPMVLNEVGWPRQGRGGFTVISDEDVRAEYMEQLVALLNQSRDALALSSIAPFAWTTAEANPFDQNEWFGLADPATGEPYGAGLAYREAVERISSPP